MKLALTALLLSFSVSMVAQTAIIGKWKTIDDETGREKSIVEIYEVKGKFYGRITKLFRTPDEDPDPVCDKCDEDDARYKKKVIGMEIVKDLTMDDDEYAGGTILDPKDGKVYRCRIWRDGENLKVRGYWGPFYRTQTWLPM